MRKLLAGTLLIATSTMAFGTAPIHEQNLRNVNLNFGIDSTDLYSGTVSFAHQDYELRIGYESTYPIIRNVESPVRPTISDYNLGQSLRTTNGNVCDTLKKRGGDDFVSFKGIHSETILFHAFNSEDPFSRQDQIITSNSRWQLNCKSPRAGYAFELTSPNGLTFLYEDDPAHNLNKFPSKIIDPNDNYINITSDNELSITLETKYETIKIDKDGVSRTDEPITIAEFEKNPESYRVNYNEDSYWEYKTDDGNFVVCNPLKLCATYYYELVRVGSKNERRIVRKEYDIPQIGTATVSYEYEKSGNFLTVEASEPNRDVEYKYFKYGVTDYRNAWRNGAVTKEEISNKEGRVLKRVNYVHEKKEGPVSGSSESVKFSHKALLEKKTTTIYGDDGKSSREVEEYHYDDHDNIYLIDYSHSSRYRYESRYRYKWDYSTDIYRVDLLKEEYLEGSGYRTSYTYDNVGNIKTKTVNHRTTTYTYYPDGTLKTVEDPAGNITTYSDYKFGVARQVIDPENRVRIRTVENGYITSESLNGRKLFDKEYDVHGKLKEYRSGAANRLPMRYTYTYPDSGGMKVTSTISSQNTIKLYNALGKVAQVIEQGGSRKKGNFTGRKKLIDYNVYGLKEGETNFLGIDVEPTPEHYTSYKYDALGRVKKITPIDEGPVTFEYYRDTQITSTDANGVETREDYKYFGYHGLKLESRRVSGGDRLVDSYYHSSTISLKYYDNGDLKEVSLGGLTTEYTYNQYGDVETEESDQTGLIRYEYDAVGNIEYKTINYNDELQVHYVYDKLNRIKEQNYGDDTVDVIYTYDDNNFIETREKGSFKWEYHYNEEKQVTREVLTHESDFQVPDFSRTFNIRGTNLGPRFYQRRNVPPRVVSTHTETEEKDLVENGLLEWDFNYTYNSIGALESITYPDGEVVSYVPNLISQPTQAIPYIAQVHYHPNGQIENIHYANGLVSEYDIYDKSGKLKSVSHGAYYSRDYRYDPTGRLKKILDMDSSFGDSSRVFQYDNAYQLRRMYAGRSAEGGNLIGVYDYDTRGSITKIQEGSDTVEIEYSRSPYKVVSVKENGATKLFSVTEDGRVQVYGNNEYHYANDELMVGYSESNEKTNVFLYDANHRKTKEILYTHPNSEFDPETQDGQLLRYTIYNHKDQLIMEERSDDTWSNFVYLRDNLVAKRDAKYLVEYSTCGLDVNHNDRTTYVHKYPIYLQKSTGVPIFIGECQSYDTWDHDIVVDEGTWQVDSSSKRTYHVWIHQFEDGEKRGTFGEDFVLYEAFIKKKFTERDYSSTATRRKYDCYNHWEIIVRKYNIEDDSYDEMSVKDGRYHTGRARYWYPWQPKPSSFSCRDPRIDPSQVSWPSYEDLMI